MENRNAATALILNDKNEFLLQKKTHDYLYAPGVWSLFGGALEKNETAEQAIKRELEEELGIKIQKIKLFKTYSVKNQYVYGVEKVFIIPFQAEISDIRLGEGAGFSFFDVSEIPALRKMNHTSIFEDIEKEFKTICDIKNKL
jgi:8-oxo-dGTP diphosphatase